MNSEYDINNYTNQELENIFGLPKNYDLLSLMEKETKLRQNIHVDKSIDDQKKIKTLLFIDNAKNKLADVIKLNINMFPKSQETTSFSNSQLKQSDVTREGTNYIIKHPNPQYSISYPSETHAGDLNPLNRRILNNYLCIDSRFRDNYYTTQSSNFNINLPVCF